MNKKPAFPQHGNMGEEYEGMSLRDYFAAKAMQSLIAGSSNRTGNLDEVAVARNAFQFADAMLKVRGE